MTKRDVLVQAAELLQPHLYSAHQIGLRLEVRADTIQKWMIRYRDTFPEPVLVLTEQEWGFYLDSDIQTWLAGPDRKPIYLRRWLASAPDRVCVVGSAV